MISKGQIYTNPRGWWWGFSGKTQQLLTCTLHAFVRFLQRVLRLKVPDDYIVPAYQQPSLFWMIRKELARSQKLSDQQASLIDSDEDRRKDHGYFMSPNGVVIILRRAEISTIYQLDKYTISQINQSERIEQTEFSTDPLPNYIKPLPIELLLVPNPITPEWGNGIQKWLRGFTTNNKTLFCETGIHFSDLKAFLDDTPVDLIKMPAFNSTRFEDEVVQLWQKRLIAPFKAQPRFAILKDPKLLVHLLLALASPKARLATWNEHFVPGLVYGIDPYASEEGRVQFFPLCV